MHVPVIRWNASNGLGLPRAVDLSRASSPCYILVPGGCYSASGRWPRENGRETLVVPKKRIGPENGRKKVGGPQLSTRRAQKNRSNWKVN